MHDKMVSVRMPASLLKELKKVASQGHYLDLSELIRSIARSKWLEHTNPELHHLSKLRDDIADTVQKKSAERIQAEVNKELEKIKSELSKGGFLGGK